MTNETYLGDGLYVRIEDGQVILRAHREGGDHWEVGMEVEVLDAFLKYLGDVRKTLFATGRAQ